MRCSGTVVCANGAIVWRAEGDDVLDQTSFEPTALIAALGSLARLLPDAAIALLSADTMFLDEAYLAQRSKKGLADALLVSSFGQVASEHAIVAVAVRHPRLVAEQLLAPVASAFAGAGKATFAGAAAVDVVPSGSTGGPLVDPVPIILREIPDLSDTELSEIERLLRPAVAAVLPLFQPREEK